METLRQNGIVIPFSFRGFQHLSRYYLVVIKRRVFVFESGYRSGFQAQKEQKTRKPPRVDLCS